MFCTRCGRELRSDFDNFCSQCGEGTSRRAAMGENAPRRMYRPRYDRKVAGVCAGFAKYIDADVNLIRVGAILTLIFSFGLAVVGYIAAWIIVPEEPVRPPAFAAQNNPVSV